LSNRDQNRQFRAAVREIERILGRELTDDEWSRLHREISKEGYDFDAVVQVGRAMFE